MNYEIIRAILEALRLAYPNAYDKDSLINAALCELSPATAPRKDIFAAIITCRDKGHLDERHGIRCLYTLAQPGRAALAELAQ